MGTAASHDKTQVKQPTAIKATTTQKTAWTGTQKSRIQLKRKEAFEKQFVDEALKLHNDYRTLHGSPPMEYSNALTAHAQTWANTLASKSMLMHSTCRLCDGQEIGENVYMGWSVDGTVNIKAKDAINSWYNENLLYDFTKPGFSIKTGHFSQLVWKTTTHMGIARAQSNEGGVYVVANYSPSGNIPDKFEINVMPVPTIEQSAEETDSEASDSSEGDMDG